MTPGPQVEVLPYEGCYCGRVYIGRPEGLDHHANRMGDADGVGDLDQAPPREARGDHVLGDPAGGVGAGAVHLGRVLAREGAPAVRRGTAVSVHDDLAPREPGVALWPSCDEAPCGVHEYLRGALVEKVLGHHRTDDGLDQVVPDVALRPLAMLGGDEDLLDADGPIPLVAHRHLALAVGPEVGQDTVLADLGEAAGQAVGQRYGQRHELRGLLAGVAEHHTLVTGSDLLEVFALAHFEGPVHALGYVG